MISVVAPSDAKYADNGGIKTKKQYKEYLNFYSKKRKLSDKLSLSLRNKWNNISNSFPVSFRTDIKRLLINLSSSKSFY